MAILPPVPDNPSVPDSPSLPEQVAASFKSLAQKATALNAASDELGKFVRSIDASLQHLNLGVEGWVRIKGGWDEPQTGDYRHHLLGYAKVGRTWGIALRVAYGNEWNPESETEESWLFNEAPRVLRVDAIDALPELLDRLSKKAESTTKKIADKTHVARELSEAIEQVVKEAAPKKKK